MKIVYVSNCVTDHIRSFVTSLSKLDNVDFCFIETQKLNKQQAFSEGFAYYNVSSGDINQFRTISYEASEESKETARKLIYESDVVIIGNAKDEYILHRLKADKLTFRAHERWYHNKLSFIFYLRSVIGGWLHHSRYKNLYLLCASAYTCADANKIFCFKNKAYKWGYFPETKKYDVQKLINSKDNASILWCGRFIDWKHPDDVLKTALRLRNSGYNFSVTMIGTGDMEISLKSYVIENHLEDNVTILGPMTSEKVRHYMEKNSIYLFTSDFKEGWGAVLNESMNSGCAVVANHAIGATPYLIKHKENGLIYKNGDLDSLYNHIASLLDNPYEQARLGTNAYKTITDTWNAEEASKRFVKFAEDIISNGKSLTYKEGPCSRAERLNNDWFEND